MDKNIEKIFRLLNSPIITPYNLLENAKLKNYEYVKYYKGAEGLIAEMKCTVDDIETIFNYEFDTEDYLQKIFMIQNNEGKYVFDRTEKVAVAKEEYYKIMKQDLKTKKIV